LAREGKAEETESQGEATWLEYLEEDHDNLRAALAWCQADAEGAEAGLRLAGALGGFWDTRGYWSEGRGHLAAALSREGAAAATAKRAKALRAAGALASWQDDFALARSLYEQ